MGSASALETIGGAAWRYICENALEISGDQARDVLAEYTIAQARDVVTKIQRGALNRKLPEVFEAAQLAHSALALGSTGPLLRGLDASFTAYPDLSSFIAMMRHGVQATAVTQSAKEVKADGKLVIPSIKEMLNGMNGLVIGQDAAKKVLCVALRNHIKRLVLGDPMIKKTNTLLIGPSGSGKTQLARAIAEFCKLPFVDINTTSLTASGYHGDDVCSIFEKLLEAAGGDLELAQHGVVFLDEIDKKQAHDVHGSADVGGAGVQHELLKLMEGTTLEVRNRRKRGQPMVKFDTSNVLCICAGAFGGLNKILLQRLLTDAAAGSTGAIGFASKLLDKSALEDLVKAGGVGVTGADLELFGLAAEFIGRCPQIARLDPLSVPQLGQVLTDPRDALVTQFKKLFMVDGIQLEFDPAAITAIAEKAHASSTGARYLRGEVENILRDTQMDLETYRDKGITKCTVTRETVEKGTPPILT